MFTILLMLAGATGNPSPACTAYQRGQHELILGRIAFRGGRYVTAYRHYSLGLRIIDAAYVISMQHLQTHVTVLDDTDLNVGKAQVEWRDKRYRAAASDDESVLVDRLGIISKVNRCRVRR